MPLNGRQRPFILHQRYCTLFGGEVRGLTAEEGVKGAIGDCCVVFINPSNWLSRPLSKTMRPLRMLYYRLYYTE
jgi:hypothetical protein